MKKLIINSIGFIFAAAFIASCDFVQNANPELSPTGSTTGSNIIYRKAFVEDYTGHKCGNCPAAAVQLKTLEGQYTGKIIPVAVHAGYFATLSSPQYTTDLRSADGTSYDTQFGNSAAGNPNGLINRIGYGTSGFIKNWSAWAGEVAAVTAMPAKFQIKIKNTFNAGTKNLDTDITIKSLDNNAGTYKLVVMLTEDSIIAEQLDYSKPSGSQYIANYEFNHVLRGSINSTWGDAIFTSGTAALNDSVVKSYTGYTLNASYRSKKCHVVAYVYDANSSSPTYYEVLQAEEAHVEE